MNVVERKERGWFMARTEVRASGHRRFHIWGHVFDLRRPAGMPGLRAIALNYSPAASVPVEKLEEGCHGGIRHAP